MLNEDLRTKGPSTTSFLLNLEMLIRRIAREEALRTIGEKQFSTMDSLPNRAETSQSQEGEQFLTVSQAAKLASVCEPTVRSWINSGRLARYNAGRHLRVKRSDMLTFLGSDQLPRSADDLGSKAAKILSEL